MAVQNLNESMGDLFIFETSQLIEQLEKFMLVGEKTSCYEPDVIDEIFRIMHTIKGASAMMLFNNIASLAHAIEDVFYFLRENNILHLSCSELCNLIFESIDFIKIELEKIRNNQDADGDASNLIYNIKAFLTILKEKSTITHDKEEVQGTFKAVIFFEEDCEMENLRAYALVHELEELADNISHIPENLDENNESTLQIRKQGFKLFFKTTNAYAYLYDFFKNIAFVERIELAELENNQESNGFIKDKRGIKEDLNSSMKKCNVKSNNMISVNVDKLDKLMNLVEEMVIAEAMVTQNPDLKGLELSNFQKAARQLNKVTGDIQDMVMSIRMVPIAGVFNKMQRIVRDMSQKLHKEVNLEIIGEETEVDKNVIEHISDPLMHLVRNALDHGIESTQERIDKGKPREGSITLEAKIWGSDILIIIKDDGKGLNKEKIIKKAKAAGLLHKAESDMSDKEIYNLIFTPGFSTNDTITEFSGRGVGMDVVTNNIRTIGGSVVIDSAENIGTTITLKIPLMLAIINGMNICVGESIYTIPIVSIKESFRPKKSDIITDPSGNEMIIVRNQCYPLLRLHKFYKIKTKVTDFWEGIVIMVEQENKSVCIFADALLGKQQVVVKALPEYIKSFKKIKGLAGCTLLGDGSISLILDIGELVHL